MTLSSGHTFQQFSWVCFPPTPGWSFRFQALHILIQTMGGMLVDLFWGTLFLGARLCFCGSSRGVALCSSSVPAKMQRTTLWQLRYETTTVIRDLWIMNKGYGSSWCLVHDHIFVCTLQSLNLVYCAKYMWGSGAWLCVNPTSRLKTTTVATLNLRLLLITVLASGLLMATLAHYYIQDDSVEMTTRQFLYDTWIAQRWSDWIVR